MTDILPPRLPGLNITVGDFLPRVRMPTLAGTTLAPVDIVEEGALAVCIYNPADVNPFPIPPRGVDLSARMAMLAEREVTLFVISGLTLTLLASWLDAVGHDLYVLSDAERVFSTQAGIPIKQVEGHNFRTHCALILQEDRVLSLLLETDPVHNFESLLAALDVAQGREPGEYQLPDQPWYVHRQQAYEQNGDEEDDEE